RPAPAPGRYYDLGGSSMVSWDDGNPARGDRRPSQFYSLGDLELRLQQDAALPLTGLIFHCSRCGSTLLTRLLEIDPGNRVFIEPRGLREFIFANRLKLDLP